MSVRVRVRVCVRCGAVRVRTCLHVFGSLSANRARSPIHCSILYKSQTNPNARTHTHTMLKRIADSKLASSRATPLCKCMLDFRTKQRTRALLTIDRKSAQNLMMKSLRMVRLVYLCMLYAKQAGACTTWLF